MALGAVVETNRRTVWASELFSASINGSTILDDDEIVLAVRVPVLEDDARAVFLKFRERKSIDFPIVNVAVRLAMSEGVIGRARVFAGAVAPVPVRLHAVESTLLGQAPSIALCGRAALAAAESARPLRRNRHKQLLLKALVERSLLVALGLEELPRAGIL